MTRRVGDSIVNVARRDRRIARMLAIPGLKIAEIARAVGVSPDTVYRKLEAIEALRQSMGMGSLRPDHVPRNKARRKGIADG